MSGHDTEKLSLTVSVASTGGIRLPAKPGDVGMDLVTKEDTTIMPGERCLVWSGTKVEFPPSMWGLLLPRSSANLRKDIIVLPGVIDTGYRGELGALVMSVSDVPVVIQQGERLVQLILIPAVYVGHFDTSDELEDTERGSDGFGSSGTVD